MMATPIEKKITHQKIVTFKDRFRYGPNETQMNKLVVDECRKPLCRDCVVPSHCEDCHQTYASSNMTSPNKSSFCHEQGQKIDNSMAIMKKIAELCQSQDLSDIRLNVGGKRYYTHKLLLCCSSDVFRVMLTNPHWPDAQKGEITLREEPECMKVFNDFLRYMYSGCVQLSHYTVLPILMLADKYNVIHLRQVCIDYMCSHIVSTTVHNHAVSWLQYAYLTGHVSLAETCREFILCNFHKIMSTGDFLFMEKDVLLDFLLDSNLVIPDEFTLFQGIVHWLQNQKSKTFKTDRGEIWKDNILEVLSSIRFPMMSLPNLCQLEKEALTNDFHSFFMESIGKAMKYHSAIAQDKKEMIEKQFTDSLQCHPRNYTNDVWSTSLVIENFPNVANNEVRPLLFSTPVSGSEADENKTLNWTADLFPKGVQFQKCIMIGLWRNIEICGSTYKTVRLVLQSKQDDAREVDVSILVMGVQDSVEHVKKVVNRRCYFDKSSRVQLFNDIVPYDDLNAPGSEFLTGVEGSTFKITIIIKPTQC